MPTLIDQLLVSLKLDAGGFSSDSKKAVEQNDKLIKSVKSSNKELANSDSALKSTREEQKKSTEQSDKLVKSINAGVKALTGLFAAILTSTGLQKLVNDTAKANDNLNFLSKRLGMSATAVSRWQGAAEMAGGSADAMAGSMQSLSQSMWRMATIGDTSILPYMNALGVSAVKSNGELRSLDDVMLDLADSLSKMDRPQAFTIAQGLGLDDGTINMLLQGRKEVERQLALQQDIVVSNEKELALSRKLNELRALASKQWEGLKTLIGNYLTPYFIRFTEYVTKVFNYLNTHKDEAKNLFVGLAAVLSLTLIPIVIRAAWAFLGLFASIATIPALVLLVVAAIAGLYKDYENWKKGSESLINWSRWEKDIERMKTAFSKIKKSISNLLNKLGNLVGFDFSKFKASDLFDAIVAGVRKASETLGHLLDALDKVTSGDFSGALSSLKEAGLAAAPEAAKGFVNGVTDTAIGRLGGETQQEFNSKWLNIGEQTPGTNGVIPRPSTGQRIDSATSEQKPRAGKDVSGKRGIRNNNPLNLGFAGQRGATKESGKDARFAIFKTPYEGIRANYRQLMLYYTGKSRVTQGRKLQTVWDIVHQWAPAEDGNNPVHYAKDVAGQLGISPHDRIDLENPEVAVKLIRAMGNMENGGYIPYSDNLIRSAVQDTGDPTQNAIASTNKFISAINKPLVQMDNTAASNFLGQSNKLKQQPKTVNNSVVATIGDININTTASTVSGNVEDATKAATKQLYQLVPTSS